MPSSIVSTVVTPAKATSMCKFCNKMFTLCGISRHQKKCSKKLAHDNVEVKKTRSYKFCILNENIHEEIMSYLSNQTLTKMQMITGDRYEGCEPELAKICCKCENDNFIVEWVGLLPSVCLQCVAQKWPSCMSECVSWTVAKYWYGVKESDLAILPHKRSLCGGYRYERATLNDFILQTCGSKKKWLRRLINVRAGWDQAKAATSRKRIFKNFLAKQAPELVETGHHYKDLTMENKNQWFPRFKKVKAACRDGDLNFSAVLISVKCQVFIKNGIGSAEEVLSVIHQNGN